MKALQALVGMRPSFTDAGRAALALTEALLRIADRADPLSDEIAPPFIASLLRTSPNSLFHRRQGSHLEAGQGRIPRAVIEHEHTSG